MAVNELKATALLEASPDELWAVLTDFEGWVKTMPSTDAAVVVARDGPGRTLLCLRYVLPLIAPRDTLVELTEAVEPGRQVLSWKAAPPSRDAERPVTTGAVRLRINEGLLGSTAHPKVESILGAISSCSTRPSSQLPLSQQKLPTGSGSHADQAARRTS